GMGGKVVAQEGLLRRPRTAPAVGPALVVEHDHVPAAAGDRNVEAVPGRAGRDARAELALGVEVADVVGERGPRRAVGVVGVPPVVVPRRGIDGDTGYRRGDLAPGRVVSLQVHAGGGRAPGGKVVGVLDVAEGQDV